MKISLIQSFPKVLALASLAGAFAVGAGGVAHAQQAAAPPQADSDAGHHGHRHPGGIVAQALALSSLTAQQRTAIEHLVQTRRAAEIPVRQADARVLTLLAAQVEQAALDRQALAPGLQAREGAGAAAFAVDRQTLQDLHDLLTPAQRGELVDAIEAGGRGPGGPRGHEGLANLSERLGLTDAQRAQIAANLRAERQGAPDGGHRGGAGGWRTAWLDSFRSDSFHVNSGSAQQGSGHRGERLERLTEAALPVLNPAQRAELAAQLRRRAAHESRS